MFGDPRVIHLDTIKDRRHLHPTYCEQCSYELDFKVLQSGVYKIYTA